MEKESIKYRRSLLCLFKKNYNLCEVIFHYFYSVRYDKNVLLIEYLLYKNLVFLFGTDSFNYSKNPYVYRNHCLYIKDICYMTYDDFYISCFDVKSNKLLFKLRCATSKYHTIDELYHDDDFIKISFDENIIYQEVRINQQSTLSFYPLNEKFYEDASSKISEPFKILGKSIVNK